MKSHLSAGNRSNLRHVLGTVVMAAVMACAGGVQAQDADGEKSPVGRIVIESSVAVGVTAAIWAPSLALSVSAMQRCADDKGKNPTEAESALHDALAPEFCPVAGGPYILAASGISMFAVPTSIYISGELAGGNGNYWYTLLGSGIGTFTGFLATALITGVSDNDDVVASVGIAALTVPTILASVIAYEASQEPSADSHKRDRDANKTTVVPGVGTTADGQGAMLSLSGRF